MKYVITLLCINIFCLQINAQITQGPVINAYAAVLNSDPCNNTFTVDDVSGFSVGDTVLMIQMKGAVIDSSNTAAFGNITSYAGAGNHELNTIRAIMGTSITLNYVLQHTYNIPGGRVQLVRVPSAVNHTVGSNITCQPWNGVKGGVAAMIVHNKLTLNADIDVSSNGFAGAGVINIAGNNTCNFTDYFYPVVSNSGGCKGEGISEVSAAKMAGRGTLANGAGGGNSHNSGGAGGGNGGAGGGGGDQYDLSIICGNYIPVLGGIGGRALNYSTAFQRLFLGGGGGGGHTNEQTDKPGGFGGGIVFIMADTIVGNGRTISANGGNVIECAGPSKGCANDGHSGGGAGGSVVLSVNSVIALLTVSARGGKGANAWVFASTIGTTGPGGGGGGGVVWYKSGMTPAGITNIVTGGMNGVSPQNGNISWNARPGKSGLTIGSYKINYPTNNFVPNILTVNFDRTLKHCFNVDFKGYGTVRSGTIDSWEWSFGDGGTSSLQNPVHIYSSAGTYKVKLKITDNAGCVDSIEKTIQVSFIRFADAGNDTSICPHRNVTLSATGGVSYLWSPAEGLDDPRAASTNAKPAVATIYTVTVMHALGCTDKDSTSVNMLTGAPLTIQPREFLRCKGDTVQFNVSGSMDYFWSPGDGLNNPAISNPRVHVTGNRIYFVSGTDSAGCVSKDSILVFMHPLFTPIASASPGGYGCKETIITLTATGAHDYTWHPGHLFPDSTKDVQELVVAQPTIFLVEGISKEGCENFDSIYIGPDLTTIVAMPDAFTPDGNGLNDNIKPLVICDFNLDYYRVYNRWGEEVFKTRQKGHGWDGTYKGGPADIGVYHYYITGKNYKGEARRYKGNFTLIR